MIPRLPLDAPIEPGRGLGGFELGRNIGEYEEVLTAGDDPDAGLPTTELWGFEARFVLPQLFEMSGAEFVAWDRELHAAVAEHRPIPPSPTEPPAEGPAVEVVVDIRDGSIVALFALGADEGPLFDRVTTGMRYRKVSELVRLEWSNDENARVVPGIEGLALHFEHDEFDWSEEELVDRPLEAIRLFLPGRRSNSASASISS